MPSLAINLCLGSYDNTVILYLSLVRVQKVCHMSARRNNAGPQGLSH